MRRFFLMVLLYCLPMIEVLRGERVREGRGGSQECPHGASSHITQDEGGGTKSPYPHEADKGECWVAKRCHPFA